ncbi:hypothetical protein ADICYQ_1400 [Cyclobacterium qasimii M12-11B]|uniref:Uncharacterized protein n=1 Tax=Cyclobacterium qasimii M12-11B TaxID=641524 RepID=S7VHC6_9BACT|nr:hypothetical protein ADICYQ_1400 [Cyclobacterium qasimii M12-11B]
MRKQELKITQNKLLKSIRCWIEQLTIRTANDLPVQYALQVTF